MRPPCEIVVKYVLPAFRSLVAKELIKKHGFSQLSTAKRLGTTQAAISYYLYSKRGGKKIKQLESVPVIQSAATKAAKEIAAGKSSATDAIVGFCRLCVDLRRQEIICELHKDYVILPKVCEICLEA